MRRVLRILGGIILVLLLLVGVVAVVGYFAYFASPAEAAPQGYSFDLAEARRLADSMPGEKPAEIRVETVAAFAWPQLLTMAGGDFATVRMGCFSYQLVTPTGHYIIDTAMDSEIAAAMPRTDFFQNAYERMQGAISNADLVAVTHEHPDHLGGITRNPDVAALHAALRLTSEQIANPERHDNPRFESGALDGYEPLQYDGMTAIAPGVVLIEAPGHTHGSQMVFVELADGREVLFLGDVAWMWANVAESTTRPRFVSEFALPGGEEAASVQAQLEFLHQLSESEPDIVQIPGHDMNLIRDLLQSGLMRPRFIAAGAESASQSSDSAVIEAEPTDATEEEQEEPATDSTEV